MAALSLFTAIVAFRLFGITTAAASCDAATFKQLTIGNIKILSLNITASKNVQFTPTLDVVGPGAAGIVSATSGQSVASVDICNIDIQYTHPGQHDTVNTFIGLPLSGDDWNSRFLMPGGGGWYAGDKSYVLAPVAEGYVSSSTDGGHSTAITSDWGLVSEGNVNWPALHDFASVALNEAATLGKLAAEIYFGSAPKYSYWTGCSTGGRQGHMMAQRYPEQFDGIIAGCPAINWQRFLPSEVWPVVMAQLLDVSPPSCVLKAFTDAALEACDDKDGVKDGIIFDAEACDYDGQSLVGSTIQCTNPAGEVVITKEMAQLVNAIWNGPRSEAGTFEWYGLGRDADLTSLLNTTCTSVDDCTIHPFQIALDWVSVFLAKNSSFTLEGVSRKQYDRLYRQSVDEYASIIGTDNLDLSEFKAVGGKMITWQGMQDELIPPNGAVDYYSRVLRQDADVGDFYRLFLAPGVAHCYNGVGFDPSNYLLNAIRAWVENGTSPETLTGVGKAVGNGNANSTRSVQLCPYPKVLTYTGSDPNDSASFSCK